jgi:hypothetical protein
MMLDQRHVVSSTCEWCESTRVARVELVPLERFKLPAS